MPSRENAVARVTITVTVSGYLKCLAARNFQIPPLVFSDPLRFHILSASSGRTDATKHSRGVTCF
jgi:hypothetical protein